MPSTKGYPIQHGIIINERKTCRYPPCSRNRVRLSAYCSTHHYRYHHYGHPDSRKIKPHEYELEKRLVTQVVNRNLDHAAIQQAIRFFDTWITRAVVNEKGTPGGKYLARLADKNVTGKECLIEIGAIWVFAWWNQHLFPSDRAMTYGLGTTILYFSHGCQKGEKIPGNPRRKAGEYIQRSIGTLLMRLLKQVEKEEDQEIERMKAINEPLD